MQRPFGPYGLLDYFADVTVVVHETGGAPVVVTAAEFVARDTVTGEIFGDAQVTSAEAPPVVIAADGSATIPSGGATRAAGCSDSGEPEPGPLSFRATVRFDDLGGKSGR